MRRDMPAPFRFAAAAAARPNALVFECRGLDTPHAFSWVFQPDETGVSVRIEAKLDVFGAACAWRAEQAKFDRIRVLTSMIRLAFITDEATQDFDEALRFAREHGLQGLELRSVQDMPIDLVPRSELRRFRRELDRHGLCVPNLAGSFYKCAPDGDAAQEELKKAGNHRVRPIGSGRHRPIQRGTAAQAGGHRDGRSHQAHPVRQKG